MLDNPYLDNELYIYIHILQIKDMETFLYAMIVYIGNSAGRTLFLWLMSTCSLYDHSVFTTLASPVLIARIRAVFPSCQFQNVG